MHRDDEERETDMERNGRRKERQEKDSDLKGTKNTSLPFTVYKQPAAERTTRQLLAIPKHSTELPPPGLSYEMSGSSP